MPQAKSVITGTGSFIPRNIKTNEDFTKHQFYEESEKAIETEPDIIVKKFEQITGIAERKYADDNTTCSDMAVIAAQLALADAGCDPETIDQIIVAHNFGNVIKGTIQTDAMPALASRVKHDLKIKNPNCIPYDILFGCPGWLQGIIQADAFIKAGVANKCLVIGAEMLSRVLDEYDRDSMIFSDGAGACIIERKEDTASGILSSSVMSHAEEELDYLYMGKSFYPGSDHSIRYIKMKGRKVYEYAMRYVPMAMKQCLDKAGIDIKEVQKVFLHQANEKMDEGIIKRLYELCNAEMPTGVMPMSIHKLGNSSVATIPTLFDLVLKTNMDGHLLQKGDIVLFGSVGAGMNINAVCYKM